MVLQRADMGATVESPIPVLRPAYHQVAGHRYDEGRMGSSVDESGRFYKPLQTDERGGREIDFYNHLQADERVPQHIRAYFPKFFGTISIEGPCGGGETSVCKSVIYTFLDKSLQRHGIMEDLASGFHHPSILDLKIGARTWYPEASEHNIKKNKVKDKLTTSGALGFRVSGMQVFEASSGKIFKADRDWARKLSVDDVMIALKRFVSSNPWNETNPDAAFAASVYGGPHGVISQLEILKDWFSTQTYYHFASSSILLIYDSNVSSSLTVGDDTPHDLSNSVSVKIVDFAHTICGKSAIDENFLEGLKSVIRILSSLV